MMITLRPTTILLLSLIVLPALADVAVPKRIESKEFRGILAEAGDLYIAGQPLTSDALEKLKTEGVNTVINLRTDKEMKDRKSTPIREEKVVKKLGMNYVHIPSGGKEHPFSPATLETFAEAMDNTDGKVLLHCNSGHRATHLWVAYLVKYKHMPLDQALRLGREANFGRSPIEGYLGNGFYYTYKGDAAN